MRKFIPACLALSIGSVIGFAILEVALRIHNPLEASARGGEISLPRNKTFVHVNEGNRKVDRKVVLRHNELGFRGPAPGPDFPDRLSIVAVGGSTTHCLHLTEGHAWPEVMSDRLSSSFPQVWVNNAGLDGHSTFGHLVLVDHALRDLSPDVILFLVGINDIARDLLLRLCPLLRGRGRRGGAHPGRGARAGPARARAALSPGTSSTLAKTPPGLTHQAATGSGEGAGPRAAASTRVEALSVPEKPTRLGKLVDQIPSLIDRFRKGDD